MGDILLRRRLLIFHCHEPNEELQGAFCVGHLLAAFNEGVDPLPGQTEQSGELRLIAALK
jgi:hypothetical protein